MKVKGEPIGDAEGVLGEADETEFTMLLVPMHTYRLVNEISKVEDKSAAEIFEAAIRQYVEGVVRKHSPQDYPHEDHAPTPEIVVRRRRR